MFNVSFETAGKLGVSYNLLFIYPSLHKDTSHLLNSTIELEENHIQGIPRSPRSRDFVRGYSSIP